MNRPFLLAIVLTALPRSIPAQISPDSSSLIYGESEGHTWAVVIPDVPGWRVNWDRAHSWGANAVLYRDSEDLQRGSGLIRILVNAKGGEDTEADLAADMAAYRAQYPHIEFRKLSISHPRYRVFSKVFVQSGEFYEYVAYLNPGPSSPFLLSVAFNKQVAPATAIELQAYERVVSSVSFLR